MSKVMLETDDDEKKPVPDEKYLYGLMIENSCSSCRDWRIYFCDDDGDTDKSGKMLWAGTYPGLGIFLTHEEFCYRSVRNIKGKQITIKDCDTHLALHDRRRLRETVEIDCEVYVSAGLFLPKEKAWEGIKEFFRTGGMSRDLKWITPDKIPEEGNYVE